jgi:hypothetical protein
MSTALGVDAYVVSGSHTEFMVNDYINKYVVFFRRVYADMVKTTILPVTFRGSDMSSFADIRIDRLLAQLTCGMCSDHVATVFSSQVFNVVSSYVKGRFGFFSNLCEY